MTREEEFLERWHAEKESYLAWGELVSDTLERELARALAPVKTGDFLRAAVKPRLKEDFKLVEKAFYRSKAYDDPYERITDKVGTRFVVLLGRDIGRVVAALEGIPNWTISKDRDYEEEQKGNPIAFDYAAVHFVVRPNEHVEHQGIAIQSGTPCEVQIKTLLQHAYSELTHDTIYKPQIAATPAMRRNAAKSMALLEATNDYFERVQDEVDEALSHVREMTANLSQIYRQAIGFDPKPSALEGLLLSAYENIVSDYGAELTTLLAERPYILDAIKRRVAESNPIFVQPSVLLAYLAIARSPRLAKHLWPLTPLEHQSLLTDLGEG